MDPTSAGPKIALVIDYDKGEASIRMRTTTNMYPKSIGVVIIDYSKSDAPKDVSVKDWKNGLASLRLKSEIDNPLKVWLANRPKAEMRKM